MKAEQHVDAMNTLAIDKVYSYKADQKSWLEKNICYNLQRKWWAINLYVQ